MALPEGTILNFATLVKAIKADEVVLAECHDAKTGKAVAVICAVNQDAVHPETGAEVEFVPLAKMFAGDPYSELIPPTEGPDEYPPCPICGEPIDYCQGHGPIAQEAMAL